MLVLVLKEQYTEMTFPLGSVSYSRHFIMMLPLTTVRCGTEEFLMTCVMVLCLCWMKLCTAKTLTENTNLLHAAPD